MYSLLSTDVPASEAQFLAFKSSLMKMVYADLDNALRAARQVSAHGGIPWEIEGDDGTKLGRDGIAKILRDRRSDLMGPPRCY